MRKVLIAVLILLLLNVNFLQGAIDVGNVCSDRNDNSLLGYTYVLGANPSNATGTIDHIDIWMWDAGDVDIASFDEVDTDTFTTIGETQGLTTVQGDNNLDAPGDFTAFNIDEGNYIGVATFSPGLGRIEFSFEQGDSWFDSGDFISCTGQAITASDWYGGISLYATGTEAGAPPVAVEVQSQILMLR